MHTVYSSSIHLIKYHGAGVLRSPPHPLAWFMSVPKKAKIRPSCRAQKPFPYFHLACSPDSRRRYALAGRYPDAFVRYSHCFLSFSIPPLSLLQPLRRERTKACYNPTWVDITTQIFLEGDSMPPKAGRTRWK